MKKKIEPRNKKINKDEFVSLYKIICENIDEFSHYYENKHDKNVSELHNLTKFYLVTRLNNKIE